MKQRELNAALFALVLSVSRTPSVRAEIDAGLPEDSQTAAVLAEINGMVLSGAVDIQRNKITAPQAKTRVKSGGLSRSEVIPPRECAECKQMFAPVAHNAAYCSVECRKATAARKQAVRKAAQKADTRPFCRLCDARFTPERVGIVYCQECRANRAKEVSRHKIRAYHLRHPELKKQRDREYGAKRRTKSPIMSCERCGAKEPLTCSHKRYCDSCRTIVDNEHKRAYDKKKAAIYKAAVAMGVSA